MFWNTRTRKNTTRRTFRLSGFEQLEARRVLAGNVLAAVSGVAAEAIESHGGGDQVEVARMEAATDKKGPKNPTAIENILLKNKNVNDHPNLAVMVTAYQDAIANEGLEPPENVIDAILALEPTDVAAQAALEALTQKLQDCGFTLAITSDGDYSIEENTKAVGTVVAVDPQGDLLTYSIIDGADADLFVIDAEGMLSFKESPDFESPADEDGGNDYEVTVMVVEEGSGQTDTQGITVFVMDVPEVFSYVVGVDSTIKILKADLGLNIDPTWVLSVAEDSEGRIWTTEMSGRLRYDTADGYLSVKDAERLKEIHMSNFSNPEDPMGGSTTIRIYDGVSEILLTILWTP